MILIKIFQPILHFKRVLKHNKCQFSTKFIDRFAMLNNEFLPRFHFSKNSFADLFSRNTKSDWSFY